MKSIRSGVKFQNKSLIVLFIPLVCRWRHVKIFPSHLWKVILLLFPSVLMANLGKEHWLEKKKLMFSYFKQIHACSYKFTFLLGDFSRWCHRVLQIASIGNRKDTVCLYLQGQMSRQPNRCRSAMLDPKGRAFDCVSGSLYYESKVCTT